MERNLELSDQIRLWGSYHYTLFIVVVEKCLINPKDGSERANLRLKMRQYYKILGTLIELPDIAKFDRVKGEYKPKKRTIPDQNDLLLLAVKLRNYE